MTDFNLFKDMATDDTLELEGKWLAPYGPEDEGFPVFLCARMGGANTKFDKVQQQKLKPYQHLIRTGLKNFDPHVMKILRDAAKESFIETSLRNWKNVKNIKGEPIAFSKEAATDLFKQLPQVYEDLFAQASDMKTFQSEDLETEAGN